MLCLGAAGKGLGANDARLVSCMCLRMQTEDSAPSDAVSVRGGCVCVEMGLAVWLKKSWEVREGKCCWREDCNCSCTLRTVTCYLLPVPSSARSLSDRDAGLNTLCLSQVFCCDTGWRSHLRGCASIYHLFWMPVQQVLSLSIAGKGERMEEGLEAYLKAAVPHRQCQFK